MGMGERLQCNLQNSAAAQKETLGEGVYFTLMPHSAGLWGVWEALRTPRRAPQASQCVKI